MDIFPSENFLLAEKLRNEDPEQFYTLVRMHLSFVLDLNTDDCEGNSEKKNKIIRWNLPFTKKQKVGSKGCFDGTVLTSEFIAQIKPVIEFLKKEENISQEGIFRRSGRVTRQQELKNLLHQGVIFNFDDNQFSVHECATVLKNILSELPESVLTDAHYPAYCQIAEFCSDKNSSNNDRLLRALQLLILLLPNENRKFFQEIIELLNLAVTHEAKNRMSADNLATLFTPHLLCPRKLSPEALHTNSQVMSRVVAFMIQKGLELFEIPPTVATDVRAYWNKKERRRLSPLQQMNESVCDGTAANTVFSFVDREKTAEENRTNPTETALAQLYAYIQSLPESSKKRKLIKQFNKENGYGTPLRTVVGKKRIRSLNLGDSIKKHLSGFSKTAKKNVNQGIIEGEDEDISSPDSGFGIKKLQYGNDEKSCKEALKKCSLNKKAFPTKVETLVTYTKENSSLTLKESTLGTQALLPTDCSLDTVDSPSKSEVLAERRKKLSAKRSSSSPIEDISPSKSAHFSNTGILPKRVTPSSADEDCHLSLVSKQNTKVRQNFHQSNDSLVRTSSVNDRSLELSCIKEFVGGPLLCSKEPQLEVLLDKSFENENYESLRKPPIQKCNISNFIRLTNTDGFLSSSNNTNRWAVSYGSKSSFLMTTSTPAPSNGCFVTPVVDKNNSMSPITKSTRRMPKAMQETMMTPRSRKPVISLSGTDLCSLVNSDSQETDERESFGGKTRMPNNLGKKLILEDSNEENYDSLSSPFRNYLFSRSVLTASPVDLSFSSRTDDFLSLSERNSSPENDHYKSLPQMLNGAGLSESLLYCLDGNEPDEDSSRNDDENKLTNCSCSSLSDSKENVRRVYETAL